MKRFILILITITFSLNCFAQTTIDEFYENKDKYLIQSSIHEFQFLTNGFIMKEVKDWANQNHYDIDHNININGTDFMVFTYTIKEKILSWYIKMEIQIKDDKIRLLVFDDMNSYCDISHIKSKTYYMSSLYFDRDGSVREDLKEHVINIKQKYELTSNSLVDHLNSKNSIVEVYSE
jgi:hypothetical protein